MRLYLFTLLFLLMTPFSTFATVPLDLATVKAAEHQLEDVMELMDTNTVKTQLKATKAAYQQAPNELNQIRLGIAYHEAALNLTFLTQGKTQHSGYAQKSYDLLDSVFHNPSTAPGFMPFVAAYKASAIALVGAETRKLSLLGTAFEEFEIAVNDYSEVACLPEFLRGSVAENLPRIFPRKRKWAKIDFESIIQKQQKEPEYANWKIMSFTFWAWANQHQGKKHRATALDYLEKAIALDPDYQAGRERAESLKKALQN